MGLVAKKYFFKHRSQKFVVNGFTWPFPLVGTVEILTISYMITISQIIPGQLQYARLTVKSQELDRYKLDENYEMTRRVTTNLVRNKSSKKKSNKCNRRSGRPAHGFSYQLSAASPLLLIFQCIFNPGMRTYYVLKKFYTG